MFWSFLVLSCKRHPHVNWVAVKTRQGPWKKFCKIKVHAPQLRMIWLLLRAGKSVLKEWRYDNFWMTKYPPFTCCLWQFMAVVSVSGRFIRQNRPNRNVVSYIITLWVTVAMFAEVYCHPFLSDLKRLAVLRDWSCLYTLMYTKGGIHLFLLNF